MHEHGRMYSRVSRDRHVSPLCGSRSVFISPGVALLISAFHICAWVKFSLCLYLLNHCSRLWTQCSCPRLSLSYVLFAICGRQLSATATRSRAVAAKKKTYFCANGNCLPSHAVWSTVPVFDSFLFAVGNCLPPQTRSRAVVATENQIHGSRCPDTRSPAGSRCHWSPARFSCTTRGFPHNDSS